MGLILILIIIFGFAKHEHAFEAGFLGASKEGKTHFEITKCALYRITFDYLETKFGKQEVNGPLTKNGVCDDSEAIMKKLFTNLKLNFKSVKNAIESIAKENKLTDIEEIRNEEAHFDSEHFDAGANRLLNFKHAGIYAISSGNFYNARRHFGKLFHTVQDFYSHSNWVEFSPDSPNSKLANSPNLGEIVDNDTHACIECKTPDDCKDNINPIILKKKLLTTGFFSIHNKNRPLGKCSHGGFLDKTKKNSKDGINKDTISSPHGHLHYQAVNLAEITTYNILKDLHTQIGNANFEEFLGFNGISIAFIFETDADFDKKVNVSKEIFQKYTSDLKINNFIFSASNTIRANNMEDLMKKINIAKKVTKKSLFKRIIDAIEFSEKYSIFFIHADISILSEDIDDNILPLIREKNIVVNVVFDVSKNFFDRTKVNTEFENLVKRTGGVVRYLSEIKNLPHLINDEINPETLQTVLIADFYKTTKTNYQRSFYSDSTFESLEVSCVASNDDSVVTIKDPLNKVFKITEKNETDEILINKPANGKWILNIEGSYFGSLKISGISNFSITSNLYIKNTDSDELLELQEPPIIGQTLVVLSQIPSEYFSKDLEKVSIDIVTKSSDIISTHYPYKTIDNLLFTSFVVPSQGFRIKFNCIHRGEQLERYEAQVFEPSIVNIDIDKNYDSTYIFLNKDYKLTYNIKHQPGNNLRLKLVIRDSLELISSEKIIQVGQSDKYSDTLIFSNLNASKSLIGKTNKIVFLVYDADSKNNETINYEIINPIILEKDITIGPRKNIKTIIIIVAISIVAVILLAVSIFGIIKCVKKRKAKSKKHKDNDIKASEILMKEIEQSNA